MDVDRTLGTLIEQGRWMAKEMAEVKADVKDIKKAHVRLLIQHWKLYAKVSGVAAITAGLVELLGHVVRVGPQ
jgi:hypothetical protein